MITLTDVLNVYTKLPHLQLEVDLHRSQPLSHHGQLFQESATFGPSTLYFQKIIITPLFPTVQNSHLGLARVLSKEKDSNVLYRMNLNFYGCRNTPDYIYFLAVVLLHSANRRLYDHHK